MQFDDLWQYLEPLSEAEIDSIYNAAGSDRRYRFQLLGLGAGFLLALAAFSLGVKGLYRAYHPALALKLALFAMFIGAIWCGVRAIYSLNRRLHNRAVMRVLRERGIAGES